MADLSSTKVMDERVYETPFGTILVKQGDDVTISDPAVAPVVFKSAVKRLGGKTYTLTLAVA